MAAVGQVHRAVADDGRDVVVKVQYPEVSSSVDADLTQLRLALRAAGDRIHLLLDATPFYGESGGQVGDVCQKNLGKTLQLIINSISGKSSPAVLEYVPMSASLAVALDFAHGDDRIRVLRRLENGGLGRARNERH